MRTIVVMFDLLNRRMLSPYGDEYVITPSFQRLARESMTFDQCYAGSLPCMPARRKLYTGRYNLLHRNQGPLEPYDDSTPSLFKATGIYAHLTTDHWHYWEKGGGDCLNQYNPYELVRGWEGDPSEGIVGWTVSEHIGGREDSYGRQEYINRYYMQGEKNQSIVQNFPDGLDLIRDNYQADRWYLRLGASGPREPSLSPEKYKKSCEDSYDEPMLGWPGYHRVTETPEQARHCVNGYRAPPTMCGTHLGKILDITDKYDIWKDIMLIANTGHGFLLTQHSRWRKMIMPYCDEIAYAPPFIWGPRTRIADEWRQSSVQIIGIAPTVLEFFGQSIPEDMEGHPLRETLEMDAKIRDYTLFDQHDVHVGIVDGRYVCMRCPLPERGQELFNYIVKPTGYPGTITMDELRTAELHQGFRSIRGCPALKTCDDYGIKTLGSPLRPLMKYETLPLDSEGDPHRNHPLKHPEIEHGIIREVVRMVEESDVPEEQYQQPGLRV